MELQNINFRGKNYRLISDVKSSSGDTSVYMAKAVDDKGDKYEILWETTDEWEDALLDGLVEPKYDINQACDWSNPLAVRRLKEEKYMQ